MCALPPQTHTSTSAACGYRRGTCGSGKPSHAAQPGTKDGVASSYFSTADPASIPNFSLPLCFPAVRTTCMLAMAWMAPVRHAWAPHMLARHGTPLAARRPPHHATQVGTRCWDLRVDDAGVWDGCVAAWLGLARCHSCVLAAWLQARGKTSGQRICQSRRATMCGAT